jgi:hypothetical protein
MQEFTFFEHMEVSPTIRNNRKGHIMTDRPRFLIRRYSEWNPPLTGEKTDNASILEQLALIKIQ